MNLYEFVTAFVFFAYNGVEKQRRCLFMRYRRCKGGKGALAVSFGVGMIVSYFCPSGFVVVLLTLALVFLGLACCRF